MSSLWAGIKSFFGFGGSDGYLDVGGITASRNGHEVVLIRPDPPAAPSVPKGLQTNNPSLQPGIALIADVVGMVPGGKIPGVIASVANDHSPKSIVINIITTVSKPIVGVPVGVASLINDGINFIVDGVMAPMMNTAPPKMIDDGNGHLIPNPALMDEYDAFR